MTDATRYWEENDSLDRKSEANDVIHMLRSMHAWSDSPTDTSHHSRKHFTLNINAPWGAGKTFFLKGLQKELEKTNVVVYFDAWKNDLVADPIGSFLSHIAKSLQDNFKPKFKNKIAKSTTKLIKALLPVAAEQLTKKFLGVTLKEIEEHYDISLTEDQISKVGSAASKAAKSLLDEHTKKQTAIQEFKQCISEISDKIFSDRNKKMPIFIIVDELDRCRPTYAVQLLECAKHIFETDGVYIIFGTNKDELIHTINQVYGAKFSASAYLRRFFDMEYALDTPTTKSLAPKLFERESAVFEKTQYPNSPQLNLNTSPASLFHDLMLAFSVQPREQERIFFILKCACHAVMEGEPKWVHLFPLAILAISIVVFEGEFKTAKDTIRYSKENIKLSEFLGKGSLGNKSIFEGRAIREWMEHYDILDRHTDAIIPRWGETSSATHWINSTLAISPVASSIHTEKVPRIGRHLNLILRASRFST